MEDVQTSMSSQNRILVVTAVVLSIALAGAGYIFLYHPPLDWQEHLEVIDDKWGVFDPSYRNWTGKVKHIGPYPITSAELVIELRDIAGNLSYTGSSQLVGPSDPPIHPGNVKRFTILLKRTRADKIDANQTAYRIDIHKYQKKWFEKGG